MNSWFRDLSVSSKLLSAFAAVLIATIALGLFATLRLSDLNDNADEMASHWVPAMKVLSEFQYNSTRFRSYSSSYLLPGSDKEHDNTLGLLKKSEEASDKALADFAALASTDQDRQLSAKLQEAWNAYKPLREDQVSLYKSGGLDKAAAYFMGPMRKSFKLLTTVTDEAIKYSVDGAAAAGKDSHDVFVSSRLFVFGALALAMALCCAAWFAIGRSVAKPLLTMTDAMGELAAGNLNAKVLYADQRDEIGKLADAMNAFKNQLAAAERSKAEQTEIIVSSVGTGLDFLAKGDLTHRISASLTGPFTKLKDDFNQAMKQLQDTMKNILGNTSQIAAGSGEISNAADDLSRRTEQQAASLEETAAALEEITATVKTTAANAKEARASVSTARAAAEEGGRVVQSATQAMDAISQSSKKITDIISVIDEIAFQTNLLALNAGVEAARAGDAGRGFAVVASEVRGLAQRSSEAAKEIKSLINASGEQVGEGVKLVGESGRALTNIITQVQHINSLVTEMAQAAEQQSTGIEEVNTAVAQMDQVTQQNAAMVEESTAASRHLAHETEALQELVGFFDVGADLPSLSRNQNQKPQPSRNPTAVQRRGGQAVMRQLAVAPHSEWDEF
ncbi:MAG: methyl-accepting chemotaxis protein [Rhizomicrobium sp.]|nr:methyl-accepting chemotaxis protein [Rhizomicrobium sp.]